LIFTLTFQQGERCETIHNPCVTNTNQNQCQNGGICKIIFTVAPFYQCSCQYGYFGHNCENKITTTTLPPVQSNCEDFNPIHCQYYAANNFCTNFYYVNKISVLTYCPRSCNTCSTHGNSQVAGKPCVDSQPNCMVWGTSGNCHRLKNQMICKKSCGLC